ncbi:hypothetical protein B484DRAFT_469888 [Ochromonadaceae sp. CCMP2298]|nr:hypothetical protein B484DRAFT_469888 [Ochromonadaceae sp. CCMP2298]
MALWQKYQLQHIRLARAKLMAADPLRREVAADEVSGPSLDLFAKALREGYADDGGRAWRRSGGVGCIVANADSYATLGRGLLSEKIKQHALQLLQPNMKTIVSIESRLLLLNESLGRTCSIQPPPMVEPESQPHTQLENGSDGSANVRDADSDYEDARVSARPHIVGGSFLCEMETQAVSNNAMQAHQDQDAELLKCLFKYKKHFLQTQWLLVGFAGSELRESTKKFGFKSHEQGSYMLDAYRRSIDLYDAEVLSPSHDPDMFKRPHDVSKRMWQLALMILKTSINHCC